MSSCLVKTRSSRYTTFSQYIEVESQQQFMQSNVLGLNPSISASPSSSSPLSPSSNVHCTSGRNIVSIPTPSVDYVNYLRTLSFTLSWRKRLENLLWTASSVFIIYYGDFRNNLITILSSDLRIRRFSLNLGLICLLLNLAIFLYLTIRLRTIKKAEERLEIIAPGAVPAITLLGLAAYILFSHALWPIWKLLTLPMLFTLFMAAAVVAPYVIPYVNMRLDMDALRGLYIRSAE